MTESTEQTFNFQDERFADIQMLRYRLQGFKALTLQQKQLIYCLSQATLYGRDITFDQFGSYNIRIRKTLEVLYLHVAKADRETPEFKALEEYLKQVWFASGIYHHYACDKFVPTFTEDYFRKIVFSVDSRYFPLNEGETIESLLNDLCPIIFDEGLLPKRVNKAVGVDIVRTSACNYYDGVSQQEVENFYQRMKLEGPSHYAPSYGLNSTLVKRDDIISEEVWKLGGKYSKAIEKIIFWLEQAMTFAENDQQRKVISLLIRYYKTGDLHDFDTYSIEWLREQEGRIDFINGFIEVYGDPMGLKGSWEGIVEYKDLEATQRTQTISNNAQWFEDHSPVAPQFRKPKVKGVTANVVCAAMLGGDEYPSSAIGINLPNADWIRAEHGSKSVTISNLTHAYNMAAKGNGFREEFVIDAETLELINNFASITDDLHTDLHECLGHGSGRLKDGTDPDALKNYGNTIEEARADLFGLYYIADDKLLELGLLDNAEAYKAQYYTYIMNGLLTQQVRIKQGKQIEEAHMQNRALIARWAMDLDKEHKIIELVTKADSKTNEPKTFVKINDYPSLRKIFAIELAEIQRIKSEGDFEAARNLVERYAIHIDENLHKEVLERYQQLDIAPYKGFINPILKLVHDSQGKVIDVEVDYSEGYAEQMLRYSREYNTL